MKIKIFIKTITLVSFVLAILWLGICLWLFRSPGFSLSGKNTNASFTVIPKTSKHETANLLIGLWNPHDPGTTVVPTKETIEKMVFTGEHSVRDYFKKMSAGSVELKDVGIFGWYDAAKPASHYWAEPDPTDADKDGYIHGHNEKWAETIKKMDQEFDFSIYDVNHDHLLSSQELGILIVIPTESPFGTNRDVYSREFPQNEAMVVDGVTIRTIAEWYTGSPPNFGTVAHELSHLFFNTADMYMDSPYRAGGFSLLDGSSGNNYLDPWQRIAAGKNWLNILTPHGSGYYELPPVNISYSVLKISRPWSQEFFLIEYRQHDEYNDVGNPGLLVWDILNPDTGGDWGRDKIRLLRANGGNPLDDNQAAYYGTRETKASTGELRWADGRSSGVNLSEIGAALNTIKFKLELTK